MTEASAATDKRAPWYSTAAGRFRVVAIGEAISWALLLIGMFFKYVVVKNEIGVEIFGAVHGGMFILYVIVTLLSIRPLRWSWWVALLALASSIPPFFTLFFEQWAARTGRLEQPPHIKPAASSGGSSE